MLELVKGVPLTSHMALFPAHDLGLAGTNARCSCVQTGMNHFVKGIYLLMALTSTQVGSNAHEFKYLIFLTYIITLFNTLWRIIQ